MVFLCLYFPLLLVEFKNYLLINYLYNVSKRFKFDLIKNIINNEKKYTLSSNDSNEWL